MVFEISNINNRNHFDQHGTEMRNSLDLRMMTSSTLDGRTMNKRGNTLRRSRVNVVLMMFSRQSGCVSVAGCRIRRDVSSDVGIRNESWSR